jgi:hypothetical protein
MPEYVIDCDGDIWLRGEDGYWHWQDCAHTWDYLRDNYWPLTACGADGEPLSPAPADEVRDLLADAFDGLAEQMRTYPPFSLGQSFPDGIRSQMAEWIGGWAATTAAGLRS